MDPEASMIDFADLLAAQAALTLLSFTIETELQVRLQAVSMTLTLLGMSPQFSSGHRSTVWLAAGICRTHLAERR